MEITFLNKYCYLQKSNSERTGAQTSKVDFVETGFPGQTDFIAVRCLAANTARINFVSKIT
jgi:hypothetical protein